ncbi:MAG: GvpL/GvpF family gas vesicle protein [Chloroflexi bacterium]|nr:GvpL/GvpF family gas vesicle protein [Chloroflexota bacterium]
MTSLCYVYAVQARGARLPSRVLGFRDRRLFAVSHRDLEAVVSEIEEDTLQGTEEDILRHEVVVEAVRQMGPAIPVRFGTVMRDPVAVANALGARYSTLAGDLERLGDKVELGVTILWHEPAVEDTAEEDESSGEQTPGTRYLRAKYSQYRRDAGLRDRAARLARELDGELAAHALDRRCTVLPTPRLMMRAAYLLRPPDVEAFRGAFAELKRKRSDLRFLLTGPWPPYSFVTTAEVARESGLDRLLHSVWREPRPAAQK